MRISTLGALVLAAILVSGYPANSYDGLQVDYKACTSGAGKIPNADIVAACTRLINNSAKKNELVGFFHALRASANTDRTQNCADAKVAFELLNGAKMKESARQLAAANC